MQGIIAFLIIFTVLVVIHEYGHYYFAKKMGILVREFAIGMGPKIFQYHAKNMTTFTIRILPLGGYVRLAGLNEENELEAGQTVYLSFDKKDLINKIDTRDDQKSSNLVPFTIRKSDLTDSLILEGDIFDNESNDLVTKTLKVDHDALIVEKDGTEIQIAPRDVQYNYAAWWKRLVVNFAGPFNNIILAIVAFTLSAFMMGGVQDLNTNKISIFDSKLPAYQAGIRTGDEIVSVNGHKTNDYNEIRTELGKVHSSKNIDLKIKRNGNLKSYNIKPKYDQVEGSKRFVIGISVFYKKDFMSQISYGFTQTYSNAKSILQTLGSFFVGGFSLDKISGPVGIYSISSQAANSGLGVLVFLCASLSISLAIANLLPIPGLDGGKILLNIIEGIRGKPLKQKNEITVTIIGASLLLVLIVVVTIHDIMKLF